MESDEDLERTCIDALIQASDYAYSPFKWEPPAASSRSSISPHRPRHFSVLYKRKIPSSRPERIDKTLILPTMMTPWLRRTNITTPKTTRKCRLQRSKQRVETQSSDCISKSLRNAKGVVMNISDFPENLDRIAISSRKRQSEEMQRKKNVKWSLNEQQEARGTHRWSERKLASPAVVRLVPFK